VQILTYSIGLALTGRSAAEAAPAMLKAAAAIDPFRINSLIIPSKLRVVQN
jgi:hypothetical protein